LRDRTPVGRHSSGRRRAFKTLLIGSAAALAGITSIIGLVIGAERLLTASIHVQIGIRSAAVNTSPAEPVYGMARFPSSVAQQWFEVAQFVAARENIPVLKIASIEASPLSAPKLDDRIPTNTMDEVIIGSISLPSRTMASIPMPQIRPKFASLTPLNDPIPEDMSRTAVYDIVAQTVYMPNGDKLEAHSGLGSMMDDPAHIHQKNRGPTPPNTYRLQMREALFHGVAAIRMLPERESEMFNRDGILAHTYMLGASGQSNGCISFRDYGKFLAAFQRGEVERIVVVARLSKAQGMLARAGTHKMKHVSLLDAR
jgi:hypothetical protein